MGIDAVQWAEMAVALGAGEVMASSLDFEGKKRGYDNVFLSAVAKKVNVPIIASSGAGDPRHMPEALTVGKADAVLAASIFNYRTYTIREVKEYLARNGIPVRL